MTKTELVPSLDLTPLLLPEARENRLAKMREIEDDVYQHALGNVEAMLSYYEVSPMDENPPEAWVEKYGLEAAQLRLKVAKDGHLKKADAPIGLHSSLHLVVGIAKARGQSVRVGTLELNARISLPAPTTADHPGPVGYEVRDLDPE